MWFWRILASVLIMLALLALTGIMLLGAIHEWADLRDRVTFLIFAGIFAVCSAFTLRGLVRVIRDALRWHKDPESFFPDSEDDSDPL
ncbi:MAG: hypothetical protein IJV58_03130 [Oscillospiraceae bacterium]|nr:hypothetical protein [Oscillospiraceae bacterium]